MEGIDISEEDLPCWLKLCDVVVMFPTNCLVDLNKDPTGLSGHASDEYLLALIVLNSLFWGFGLVVLYHRVARLFITKNAGKLPP